MKAHARVQQFLFAYHKGPPEWLKAPMPPEPVQQYCIWLQRKRSPFCSNLYKKTDLILVSKKSSGVILRKEILVEYIYTWIYQYIGCFVCAKLTCKVSAKMKFTSRRDKIL